MVGGLEKGWPHGCVICEARNISTGSFTLPTKDIMPIVLDDHHHVSIDIEMNLPAIIGIKMEERLRQQKIIVSLSLIFNTHDPAQQQADKIRHHVETIINTHKPYLLERLSYIIGHHLIQQFSNIKKLTLTIKKPEALKAAQYAYVTMTMESA